jgi:hypothetical protein
VGPAQHNAARGLGWVGRGGRVAAAATNGCWLLDLAVECRAAALDVGPDAQQVRLEQEPWLVEPNPLLEHLLC